MYLNVWWPCNICNFLACYGICHLVPSPTSKPPTAGPHSCLSAWAELVTEHWGPPGTEDHGFQKRDTSEVLRTLCGIMDFGKRQMIMNKPKWRSFLLPSFQRPPQTLFSYGMFVRFPFNRALHKGIQSWRLHSASCCVCWAIVLAPRLSELNLSLLRRPPLQAAMGTVQKSAQNTSLEKEHKVHCYIFAELRASIRPRNVAGWGWPQILGQTRTRHHRKLLQSSEKNER